MNDNKKKNQPNGLCRHTPTPVSAAGQQKFASGTLTNHLHICPHREATLKYHNQTCDTEIRVLLRSGVSTWTFSQSYIHTHLHRHFLLILKMKSLCFTVLSQYIQDICIYTHTHIFYIYIFILILLRSCRIYSMTRGEEDLKCFKRATKGKTTKNI